MSTPFTIERTYPAAVTKVWQAITDKEKMKQWYFNLDEFNAKPGFEFSFPGKGAKGETYIHLCKVLEATENKKLSYSWTYKDYPGYSVVTFELFEEGKNSTRVKLTHTGLETFPALPDFAPSSFQAGWTQLIGTSLKNFLEKE